MSFCFLLAIEGVQYKQNMPMSHEVVIAQVELVGEPRKRKVAPGTSVSLERTSRIVIGLNETTGMMMAIAAADAPIVVSDLPHISLETDQRNIDLAEMGRPSVVSVRKDGTTTTGVRTQVQFEARGAKPGFRMPKWGGFSSAQEAGRIAAIRKSRQG